MASVFRAVRTCAHRPFEMWGRTAGQGLKAGLRGYPILALNAEDSENSDSEAQPSPGKFLRGAGSSEAAEGVGTRGQQCPV